MPSSYIPQSEELIDIAIAVVALSVGFALALSGGITGAGNFISIFPIAFVAIVLSFPLHEYMHKIVAQKYGAVAAFKRSDTGIIFTLITGALGFLFGMPGATVIYTNTFTLKEEGYVSIAGPLTNFAIFIIFFLVSRIPAVIASTYLSYAVAFILYINLWLAFFNMLPLYPLDGSKVLRWSRAVYASFMLLIVVMLFILAIYVHIIPAAELAYTMCFAFVLALIMSRLYRGIVFR